MQRGSAALLILLVVLLAAGSIMGLVYMQTALPKPQVTPIGQNLSIPTLQPAEASGEANTQKYQDSELNFEFQYNTDHYVAKPDTEDDYNKRENGNFRKNFAGYVGYQPGDFVKAVAVVNNSDGSFRTAPFTIWVFDNPNNLDPQAWFSKYWYYPFNWGQFESVEKRKLAPVNEATISGELANYGSITYQEESPDYYYIPKEGKMFLIRVLHDDQRVGQQILTSFQFVK